MRTDAAPTSRPPSRSRTHRHSQSRSRSRGAGARPALYVPVHASGGVEALRLARLDSGERVALAFTELTRLRAAMGPDQPWTRLAEPALRSMLRPLGVSGIRIDAWAVADRSPRRRPPHRGPRRTTAPTR
ncbi:hypothetical protein HDA32_003491 [Spinactinospora alkalitolerans]|uniref:SseB protein N-terminal domain-containing protein n=2 Tax=Spinactinospora alkalitolerans TaxID=687207 RepID=A0A852TXA8_9ACTN|nr:SAV_915 family protein [Spinactinospora alkalitolerans]NYE48371.1 hypothetical protein [Spinactinospora alkalitolerans]